MDKIDKYIIKLMSSNLIWTYKNEKYCILLYEVSL